jgi:hypothetical protein
MLICERRFTSSAGFALYSRYRRTRSVSKRPSRPFTCPGRLLVVTGWRPALHAGDARGQVHGRGRGATGARAQSLPIKNMASASLIRPSREVRHNLTRIDHTRAAQNPWRGGRSEALAPRDVESRRGSCASGRSAGHARPTRPHLLRDARPSRSLEGHSSGSA